MISVPAPQPPGNYEADVRIPGTAFLAVHPHPSAEDWKGHRHWKAVHSYLYAEMHGICVYCASFTPRRSSRTSIDHTSIDHFVPKGRNPALAFEWTNFRLCRARLNNRKGDFEDVIDPYLIQNGWFRLNFTTFALYPDSNLPLQIQQQIANSISRLGLNDDDAYVNERARVIYRYADAKLPYADIQRRYPFIASEMQAQNFDAAILPRFQIALANPRLRGVLVTQGWIA